MYRVLGFFVAVVLERFALSVGIWSYGPFMPILPFLGVGLTPVLKMMILPVLGEKSEGMLSGMANNALVSVPDFFSKYRM